MLALRAVQRHTAASMSARPWMREQQGSTGGLPTLMLSNPLRTLAQTPNLRVSLGQLVPVEGLGFAVGFGFGFGLGPGHVPQELTRAKKKRLSARKRASEDVVLDAISQTLEELGV